MKHDADSLRVTGPGGFGAEVRGSSPVFLAFLALLMVGFMAATAWWAEAKAAERQAATAGTVRELQASIVRQEETVKALIWVLSRPQAEREALNLQKPDILRRMAQ